MYGFYKGAPEDGPIKSETCRAATKVLIKTYSVKPHCVSRWPICILQKCYTDLTMSRKKNDFKFLYAAIQLQFHAVL